MEITLMRGGYCEKPKQYLKLHIISCKLYLHITQNPSNMGSQSPKVAQVRKIGFFFLGFGFFKIFENYTQVGTSPPFFIVETKAPKGDHINNANPKPTQIEGV